MKHGVRVTLLALATGAALAMAQGSAPEREGTMARLPPLPEPGLRRCFALDQAASGPDPRPRALEFRLAHQVDAPDAFHPRGERHDYFQFRAEAPEVGRLATGGECAVNENGTIRCGVDDDGGAVLIRETGQRGQLLVDLQATGRIRMFVGESTDVIDLTPLNAGSGVFLLAELPASRCPAYEDWHE
jgi:hypothetical protein